MEQLTSYYNDLVNAYDSKEVVYYDNSDRCHNAMILRLMLEKGSHIKMFCGEMSIFRNEFYDIIDNNRSNIGSKIKSIIQNSLSSFISRDNTIVEIILEKDNADFLKDLILPFDKLKDKFLISYLPDSIENKAQILHFSIADDGKITRIESNKEDHTAICRIGKCDDNTAQRNFEQLKSFAIPVYVA